MLRRLVRSYYRLRYFPRLIIEMLTGLSDAVAGLSKAVAGLHRYEAEMISLLMSAHEERLARVHEEIAAFCDDAIRAMITVSASTADIGTRIMTLQHGLQRVDNGIVDVQGRAAGLQRSIDAPQTRDEPTTQADPRTIETLTEMVRRQAAQLDRLETLIKQQARGVPAPAHAGTMSNGPGLMAGDANPLDSL